MTTTLERSAPAPEAPEHGARIARRRELRKLAVLAAGLVISVIALVAAVIIGTAGVGVGDVLRSVQVSLLGGTAYRAGTGVASGSSAPAGGDVAVALDVPYGLASSTATAKLATFGRTPATFDALMAVLKGQARAAGHSPVAVGQTPVGGGCAAG